MSEKLVKTVKGEEVARDMCRYISGEYYKVGDPKVKGSGDCYKIGDRYYREETGYIVFDESTQEYVIANDNVIKGIVGFNEDTREFIFGNFTKNSLFNVNVVENQFTSYVAMKSEIVEKNRKYRFHVSSDCYYNIGSILAHRFNELPHMDNDMKYRLPYNCDGVLKDYISHYEKAELAPSESTEYYSKFLGDLTYGFEFETVKGYVPNRFTKNLGLIPLRDGSISGLEYATIPYQGAKGLAATKLCCEALTKYTKFDDNCSLHLHIGGMPRTKEFLLALFKVLALVQDEMFSLFPLYKKYNFGVKRKNYTKPLPTTELLSKMDGVITPDNVDKNFEVLFRFLSMGISIDNFGGKLEGVDCHPSDPRGRSKWNIRSRYHWVNLIPIVFGNKKTVEFRIHTPTTDFNKVSGYLFLCGAIINYTKKHQDNILKGIDASKHLTDILFDVYRDDSGLIRSMSSYIDNRKNTTYQQNSQGNIKGDEHAIKAPKIIKSKIPTSTSADDIYIDSYGRVVRGMPTGSSRRTSAGLRSAMDMYMASTGR